MNLELDPKQKKISSSDIVTQLLESIRGSRTQKYMSEQLGYNYNQWHKWESGQKQLMWPDLIEICRVLELPLQVAIERVVGEGNVAANDGRAVYVVIWRMFANLQIKEMGHYFSLSESKIQRILNGKQEVEVRLILKMVKDLTSSLPLFLEVLSLKNRSRPGQMETARLQRRLTIEANLPWLCALEALVVHVNYQKLAKHDDRFFAEQLGISPTAVQRGFRVLEEAGAVEVTGGKYTLTQIRIDMESDIESSSRLAKFWTSVCLDRFSTSDGVPTPRRGWGYRIFPVSAEAKEELRERMREYLGDVAKIILRDKFREKSFVQVLMVHQFDQDELRKLKFFKDNTQI